MHRERERERAETLNNSLFMTVLGYAIKICSWSLTALQGRVTDKKGSQNVMTTGTHK